jgi:hypothetical protein
MNAAVKQWVVKVISPPVGALAVLRDGVPLPTEISSGAATPVEGRSGRRSRGASVPRYIALGALSVAMSGRLCGSWQWLPTA